MRGLALAGLLAAPLSAQTQVLVVSGLGGEPRYQEAFRATALAVAEAARGPLGAAANDVVVLTEDPAPAAGVAGRSTRQEIGVRLSTFAERASPDGMLLVVLLGHGSATGGESRLNLPGPDLTAADLAAMLAAFPTQQVIVVNAASASGDWVAPLAGPRRSVVTATRSGAERDETHFGRHFADALEADEADRDKDGRLSLWEAFEYARREVARVYQRDQRLQTEHALLEADGDSVGSREPDPLSGDGAAAALLYLTGRTPRAADPAVAGLEAQRDSLTRAVTDLRVRKDTMAADAYERRLEALLVALARVNRDLRARDGRDP